MTVKMEVTKQAVVSITISRLFMNIKRLWFLIFSLVTNGKWNIFTFLEECNWEWYEGKCSKSCGGGIRTDRIGLKSGSRELIRKCYDNFKGRRERTKFCNTKKCNTINFDARGELPSNLVLSITKSNISLKMNRKIM